MAVLVGSALEVVGAVSVQTAGLPEAIVPEAFVFVAGFEAVAVVDFAGNTAEPVDRTVVVLDIAVGRPDEQVAAIVVDRLAVSDTVFAVQDSSGADRVSLMC